MRVGFFRRALAFAFDALLTLLIVTFIFQILFQRIIVVYYPNIDEINEQYYAYQAEKEETIKGYQDDLDAGLITDQQYEDLTAPIIAEYDQNVEPLLLVKYDVFRAQILYFYIAFTVIYYVYSVVTKGNTIGRKIMKIALAGRVNWWTLLFREVFWKVFYYTFTMVIFGLIADFVLITFTKSKRAPRDYMPYIRVIHEGIDYPF